MAELCFPVGHGILWLCVCLAGSRVFSASESRVQLLWKPLRRCCAWCWLLTPHGCRGTLRSWPGNPFKGSSALHSQGASCDTVSMMTQVSVSWALPGFGDDVQNLGVALCSRLWEQCLHLQWIRCFIAVLNKSDDNVCHLLGAFWVLHT